MSRALLCALSFAIAAPALAQSDVSPADRLLHEQMLVLDTHLDTSSLFERDGLGFRRLA